MPRYDEMAENIGRNEQPEFTGRSIVLFRQQDDEGDAESASRMQAVLKNNAGLKAVASSLDMNVESYSTAQADAADALTLPRLGIAVLPKEAAEGAALMAMSSDKDSEIEAIIPEKYDRLLARESEPLSGLQGIAYRPDSGGPSPGEELDFRIDPVAIRRLTKMLRLLTQVSDALSERDETVAPEAVAAFADTAQFTWGLQATRVTTSRFSGRGVKVAVIDTGLDIGHRDFRGRRIVRGLFAPPGTSLDPTNAHGTHCTGTACGARNPAVGPRYGIAYESVIYALKVFNDAAQPGARRGDVLAAMDAANRAGCRVLSLSLGSATNGAVDPEYARAITRLRRAGSLTVAAAGNEGRSGFQVGAPASSPDAVAVAAVDSSLRRADFSNMGSLDIAGPGVSVLSSVLGGGTQRFSGTSMATPHVAGIAALWLQANPGWTVDQLETGLRRSARRLPQSAAEVGAGLVQAPQ